MVPHLRTEILQMQSIGLQVDRMVKFRKIRSHWIRRPLSKDSD